jgi:hypothetical protein
VAPSAGAAELGFAMVPVCDDVYVDPETPPPRLDLMRTTPSRAAERIVAWYGPLRAPRPRVVFCDTDACRLFFAGPAKRGWDVRRGHSAPGAAYVSRDRATLVIVCADARAERMLAHELSHEELAHRTRRARVPAWFDEGLATHLSGEPDCARALPPVVDDLRTLDRAEAWQTVASDPKRRPALYCQARAAVAAWLTDDGHTRFTALLKALNTGTTFDIAYGSPATDGDR